MTATKIFATAALSLGLIVATSGGAFAATYAWMEKDANVRKNPLNIAKVVNWVEEGQKVKVIGCEGNWCKLQIAGPDGWVKKSTLDYDYDWFPGPGSYNGPFSGQACVYGEHATFCIGN
jgi:uncharacterized protein YraI